jgi:branched-chain amino acid transport system ATP-binding protein
MSILELDRLSVNYGPVRAVQDVTLALDAGETVAILGPNGAGKSTLLNTISGLKSPRAGQIRYRGRDCTRSRAHTRARNGLVLAPEGRGLFPRLTVEENLKLAGWGSGKAADKRVAAMLDRFPRLQERTRQPAGNLSGGEQQMLCLARALVRDPAVLLLDEPSMGLAPAVVAEIYDMLRELSDRGVTLLVVEQNVGYALQLAARGYVLVRGEVVLSGTSKELSGSDIFDSYLGR